jgi:hypothetical protein
MFEETRGLMFDITTSFGLFDAVGLALTLLGLAWAWWQARLAKSAAKAAELAVKTTAVKLATSQLLVALASLQQVISDIDAASENENKAVAQFCLVRFGLVAAEAATLVRKEPTEDGNLAEDLDSCGIAALDAKAALVRSSTAKVGTTTKSVRSDLGLLNIRIASALTSIRYRPGGHANVD